MATASIVRVGPDVVLKLSWEEAGTLLAVLDNVGGDPTGPREHIDGIGRALRGAKVEMAEVEHTGSVYLF